jgi:hypothetical protein
MSTTQIALFPHPAAVEARRTIRRNYVTFLLAKKGLTWERLTPEQRLSAEVLCDPAHTPLTGRFMSDIRLLTRRA